MWRILQKTGRRADAFAVGHWEELTRPGAIRARGLKPISPPDAVAALGLATVTVPEDAGWFVEAGRRLHVRTAERRRQIEDLHRQPAGLPRMGARIYSYESLAQLGWAVGVAATQPVATRLHWDAGRNGEPLGLDDFFAHAIGESPDTGCWIIAGLIEMDHARGRLLTQTPPGLLAEAQGAAATLETTEISGRNVYSLFAAVLVRRDTDGVARLALERFFPPEARNGDEPIALRLHYAPFADPAPEMDPSRPFEAIWDVSDREPVFPGVTSVLEAQRDSTVRRGLLAVWAVKSLVEYDLYPEPDLVDLLEMDDSILVDQRWASSNHLFTEPIYEKPRLLLQRPVAEKIVRIHQRLYREGLRLKVFDAYRPLSVTQRLWSLKPNTPYLADPVRGSRHNRAAAVDLTITNAAGIDLEMPSDYLDLDERAHRDSPFMTQTARRNMEYLTAVMATEGFTTIREEWWHYDAPQWEQYPVLDVPLWPDDGKSKISLSSPQGYHDTLANPSVRDRSAPLADDSLDTPRRRQIEDLHKQPAGLPRSAEIEYGALPPKGSPDADMSGTEEGFSEATTHQSRQKPDFAGAAEIVLPDHTIAVAAPSVSSQAGRNLRADEVPGAGEKHRKAKNDVAAEGGGTTSPLLDRAISDLTAPTVGHKGWRLGLVGAAVLAASALLVFIYHRL